MKHATIGGKQMPEQPGRNEQIVEQKVEREYDVAGAQEVVVAGNFFDQPGNDKAIYILLIVLVVFSAGMVIGGALWTAFIFENLEMCGNTKASASFEIYSSGENRYLVGNQCPGYDWTGQQSPYKAGVYNFNYSVPLTPINCTSALYVGDTSAPVYNHVGYTISGVQLFGPLDAQDENAVEYEGWSFDDCGGHVTSTDGKEIPIDHAFPFNNADNGPLWSADYPTGSYHYHQMPGDEDPRGHDEDMNLNYTLCEGVRQWYNESNNTHSPIMGFMLDGYAIYGPKGANGELPQGLDECGGHYYDLGYYHYHVKSEWPFLVNCLWGRVDPSYFESQSAETQAAIANHNQCSESTTQWTYEQLSNYSYSYGSDEDNGYEDVGCLSVLIVGLVLLLYSVTHLVYISVTQQPSAAAKYVSLSQEDAKDDSDVIP